MLAMATANSITLIVTLIRPVPQYSVSGVLMQLGATEEATLARRSFMPEAIGDNATDVPWPPSLEHRNVKEAWPSLITRSRDYTVSTSPISISPDSSTMDTTTPSALPSLLPRAPCRHEDCGEDYYFKDPKPKPSSKPQSTPQKVVEADAYIDMVMGMLGICIMRV